jgi:hypothetical protein
MRLRIETHPPLPPIKVWFNASSGLFGLGTRTFNDLRKRLILDYGLPEAIQLQFDGFDLPGEDSIEGMLEKDDLVTYVPIFIALTVVWCLGSRNRLW